MEWIWKRLSRYVGQAKLQVEFNGITRESLEALLHQEALERLRRVQLVLFSEELDDQQKVETLQQYFLENT